MVQEKYCDTTERIVGTNNKGKRSEKETKEDVQAGRCSNGVMFWFVFRVLKSGL